jgi:hypothetical protein
MDSMEDNNFLLFLTEDFSIIRYIALLLDCRGSPTFLKIIRLCVLWENFFIRPLNKYHGVKVCGI